MTKNIENKSENPSNKIDLGLTAKTLSIFKKLTESQNSILKNLKNFEKSSFFEVEKLKKGELVFDEGTQDDYIYIIKKGNVSVEKYVSISKNKTKTLATLGRGSIFGEQSLNNPQEPKQTLIKALNQVELLKINSIKSLRNFMHETPELGMTLLMKIIDLTNERLNNVNEELTCLFEFNNKVASLSSINRETFSDLFDFINGMIVSDYIIFLKSNPVVKKTLKVFYDSRKDIKGENNSLGQVISYKNDFIPTDFSEELFIEKEDNFILTKLNIGKKYCDMLFIEEEKKGYSENHKKILSNFTLNLSSILNQFNLQEEEKERLILKQEIY